MLPVRNLGISRQLAIVLSFAGVLMTVSAVVGAIFYVGITPTTGPVLGTVLVALIGTAFPSMVSALKSTEAADTAAKTKKIAEMSASEYASLRMEMREHMGNLCTRVDCPLRITEYGQ